MEQKDATLMYPNEMIKRWLTKHREAESGAAAPNTYQSPKTQVQDPATEDQRTGLRSQISKKANATS